MSAYIEKGNGFNVENDFARAWADLPIELAPDEYARPGCTIGYIAGKPDAQLGFLRRPRVRVHVSLSAIKGAA